MEYSIEVPQKVQLLYDPEIQLLGIYQGKRKQDIRDIYTLMFTAALLTIVKIWKSMGSLKDEWVKMCSLSQQNILQP